MTLWPWKHYRIRILQRANNIDTEAQLAIQCGSSPIAILSETNIVRAACEPPQQLAFTTQLGVLYPNTLSPMPCYHRSLIRSLELPIESTGRVQNSPNLEFGSEELKQIQALKLPA
jgi:hypothetical protein